MAELNLRETFKKSGVYIDVTSAILRDPNNVFGVKRDDTDEVIIASGTPMVKVSTGIYTYSFDEPIGETGLTYTYWVEWVYEGRTYRDVHQVTGSVEGGILAAPTRQMTKYVNWIKREFSPLELVLAKDGDEVIEQQVENAIRYWNNNSAYKISDVYEYTPGTDRVQIDANFKTVVDVIPTKKTTFIWNDHPLWTLTGITVLDNVTTDLIMMSEAFRNYRIYVGTNFRHWFHKSDDPTVGGYLYCVNVPAGVSSVYVIGTKRITENENIISPHILDWILYYSKALVKQVEGNILRKTAIIDMPLDGQALYTEGREEQKALQESLARNSRWVVFMKRK